MVRMRDVVEAAVFVVAVGPAGGALPLSLAAARVSVALERLLRPAMPHSFVVLRIHHLVVVILGLLAQEAALAEHLVLQHADASMLM